MENNDYLWTKHGETDAEIERLESLLSPYAFDANTLTDAHARRNRALPGPAPGRPRAHTRRRLRFATIAALIALIVVVSWLNMRLQWPMAQAWSIKPVSGTATIDDRILGGPSLLPPGGVLRTGEHSAVQIEVARIGRVVVGQDSQVELVETRSGHHRLRLDHGEMSAKIWAPPITFGVQTPLANVLDIGCEFTLSVTSDGSGLLRVRHGWVELEKYGSQSLIPEGAQAELDSKSGPGTPFDDHATVQFRTALKAIDALGRSVPTDDPAIEQLANASSATDAITLISLLARYPQLADTPIYDRAIAVIPPPAGLTRDAVRNRNPALMDGWWRKLPYSRVKSWWLRWPDLLQDETP
jgi:ferric-dicitrate binding protein FerR (iron transport regulator)